MSLSVLKPGRKWCVGRLGGKGKGLPGKDWEKGEGCRKAGKGGGWAGLGGELSPVMLKGAWSLGNSPCGRARGKGSLGEGRPSLNMSWLEPEAACLQCQCHHGAGDGGHGGYLYISWDRGAPSTMVMDDYYCHYLEYYCSSCISQPSSAHMRV